MQNAVYSLLFVAIKQVVLNCAAYRPRTIYQLRGEDRTVKFVENISNERVSFGVRRFQGLKILSKQNALNIQQLHDW